jgi:diguanylate cyclase (GGDEF)-like protein/PAS domain S-box-containing protein
VHLTAQGLAPADRVALAMRNLPEWPVACFAAGGGGVRASVLRSTGRPSVELIAQGRMQPAGCAKVAIEQDINCQVAFVGSEWGGRPLIPLIGEIAKFFRGSASRASAAVDDELFRSIAEHSADVLCKVGPTGRFSYVSPSARAMFGINAEEMIGSPADETIMPDDRPIVAAAMVQLASGEATEVRTQVRALRPDGRVLWVEASAKRVQAPGAGTVETFLVLRDITSRKALEQELTSQAREDGLTGLANRRALDEALEHEWRRTVRAGSQMALVLLDVDHFKRFNDHYGHQAGDDCLRAVASVVGTTARRGGALAGRYGGEEFAVLLGDPHAHTAEDIAAEIRSGVEALAIPHAGIGHDTRVTVSVGIATALARVGGSIRMPESLVQAADNALYRAKDRGRNRVEATIVIAPPAG